MGYLGVPYRLAWEGKFFRTGLTDVSVNILRPDGSLSGPISLSESGDFPGLYLANYGSTLLDPEGEYLATVTSPTEGLRDTHRFTLSQRPTGGGNSASPETLEGFIQSSSIVGTLTLTDAVLGVLQAQDVILGSITSQSPMTGEIQGDEVEGIVNASNPLIGEIE